MDYALKERENQEFFKKQIKEDEDICRAPAQERILNKSIV